MDEIWERAVETALEGQTDHASARALTLDGAVKCVQGRLPPPSLLEKFENLQHLSIANIGVSTLEQFPRLRNLQKLILSDNRIAGGLEFLVEAGLESLRDLDLSNNRIQYIEDLAPLAQLRLVSLDLYECPVTRVKDYRSRVFGLIRSLKYLDKMDAEENERPESDDEEDDDEEEEEEDDPGSGEVEGEERPFRMNNGHSVEAEGIVDVDEDEESDADEEETETARQGEDDGDEEEQGVEDDGEFEDEEEGEEEDEDSGAGFLMQPVGQAEVHDAGGSDMEPEGEEDADGEEEVEDDDELPVPPSSSHHKRKRDDDGDDDEGDDEEDDDVVEYSKSSKKHH
ncbi:hypothetical protein Tsubulata_039418 [Turnera subulata]|uniref:U2A'/phosphoprotein 32 family A C-terminal domain-containing protein n=1 Tax=Turnera subulata TaxID=218843 RepID=A0A9Q0JHK6_9ROSI|nr:hypothetical protein Tsubulata_039418 [Turnera subulata]